MNDYTYDEAMQNYDLWKDEYDENGLNVYSFGAVVNGLFEYCKRIRFENDSEPYERLNFITESYNSGFTTLEETLEAIVTYGKKADAQSNMPDWA